MSEIRKLAALKTGDWVDFWGNANPKCPHCGSVYDIAANDHYSLYNEDDSHLVDCPRCNLEFNVSTSVTYSFSTDQQDEADEEAGWEPGDGPVKGATS